VIQLTLRGRERPMPPSIELTAYRVIQEALTNALKHAAGATVSVIVEYGDDQLRVEITDSGGQPSPSAGSGQGSGLDGLRDRVAGYGGTLTAARRAGGDYRVVAAIPLSTE
jgi:signal transduction histidine kinase